MFNDLEMMKSPLYPPQEKESTFASKRRSNNSPMRSFKFSPNQENSLIGRQFGSNSFKKDSIKRSDTAQNSDFSIGLKPVPKRGSMVQHNWLQFQNSKVDYKHMIGQESKTFTFNSV